MLWATLGCVPAVVHASVLFALSATPDLRFASEPVLDTVLRKLGHLGAYALLAILVSYGLRKVERKRRWLFTMVIVTAYAISDEAHQSFVPGRVGSPIDIVIDGLGGLAGLGIVHSFEARSR